MPARKKYGVNREEFSSSTPAWMVTYGDMTTLILCFFVILFGFSQVNEEKFQEMIASLRAAFRFTGVNVLPGGKTLNESRGISGGELYLGPGAERIRAELEELASTYAAIQDFVAEEGLQAQVHVTQEERGIVVSFADRTLFDLGRAEIRPEAREILDRVAGVIKRIPNQVRVEGHTDTLPINTPQFPSNWELSTTRATNVVRYFVETQGIPPQRLSAAGYGEYRPLVPNDTPAHMAQNRRVDIVILRSGLSEAEAQGRKPVAKVGGGKQEKER